MSKTPDLFILAEHADLLKKLAEWDVAYHKNDAPIVDDATYDAEKTYKLAIICSSSKDGANFNGAANSTLIVDNLEVIGE